VEKITINLESVRELKAMHGIDAEQEILEATRQEWIRNLQKDFPLYVVNDIMFLTEIPTGPMKCGEKIFNEKTTTYQNEILIKLKNKRTIMYRDGVRIARPDEIVRWRK